MKAFQPSLACTAGLLAGSLLVVSVARAAESDAFPEFENFIKFSGYTTDVSGSKAAFQRVTQKESAGSLGIEEFSYAKDLNDTTSLKLEGRALVGAEDYLAGFKLTKAEAGSFDASFKSFRTFYDGAGGFFPLNNAWLALYPRERYVDRAKFTVGGTIAIPNAPVFSLRYTKEARTGKKDSTIWGDTDHTGIPINTVSSLNPITANRRIIPAYIKLDEQTETLDFTVSHKIGNTSASLSYIYSRIDNDDYRTLDRYPGEIKPYPAFSTSLPGFWIGSAQANNQVKGTDAQGMKEDSRTITGKIETVINPKVTVYAEGLVRHATADLTGARLLAASFPTVNGVQSPIGGYASGSRPVGTYTSIGQIDTDSYTGVVGVQTKLLPDLGLNVALRKEIYDVNGYNNVSFINYLIVPATGTVTAAPLNTTNRVRISEKPTSPSVNIRYSGIKTVALYADWDYRSSPSDERTNYVGITTSGTTVIPSVSNAAEKIKEKHSNLKLGANWTPCTFFNARAELFTKDHSNNFTGYDVNLGDYYRLDYDISGARLSATVKPLAQLSFTTRFVEQISKVTTVGDSFAETDSGDSKLYQLSESVDWTPNKAIYVQLNANITYDTVSTSYRIVNGTGRNVVHDANNNYWNGSLLTGFVVGPKTDLQIQGTYYKSNNYQPALSGSTLAYGMSAKDSSITVGLKHKLSETIIASAKLGYVDSNNETSGGNSDFHGLVGYVALDYKL